MLVGVVVVGLVAFTGYQALKAKDALQLVADDFTALSGQITSGDSTAASGTLGEAQAHAAEAKDNTRGPGWWLTSKLPGVGDNIVAVRTVADVVDGLATDVLPTVVDATATLRPENLRPHKGRVDLEPIENVAPSLVEANRLLQAEAARVQALRPAQLAPQIGEPVRLMQYKLGEAASLSDRASRAVQLLPSMLGAGGKRTYLLLFQNNAEVRATGGIPGSFATVVAEDGRIRLASQSDADAIGRFDAPPSPLTADERALFGENLGRYPQNVTFTPDFRRSAELIRAMWNERHGVKVDGVVSTDPVALSYLLRGAGPVPLPTGRELTAENAVQLLLSDAYAEIPDPTQQNAFFAASARSVFEAVSSGQGDPKTVLQGLTQGAEERRILMWSADDDEQALIEPTALSGSLRRDAANDPYVGVYLNDATGTKMDYYLDYNVDVDPVRCQGERQLLEVVMTMKSNAPARGAGLPAYVVDSLVGVPRGTIRTTLYGYAPVDGYVEEMQIDDQEPTSPERLDHDGRSLASTTLDLEPGQTRTVRFTMVSGEGQTGRPLLRVTPGVRSSGVGTVGKSAC